jgi:hypothetical protein
MLLASLLEEVSTTLAVCFRGLVHSLKVNCDHPPLGQVGGGLQLKSVKAAPKFGPKHVQKCHMRCSCGGRGFTAEHLLHLFSDFQCYSAHFCGPCHQNVDLADLLSK